MARTRSDQRRERTRNELFGDEAWGRAWQGPQESGFACIPRVLPILLQLAHAKSVTGTRDCRGALLELYCQNWGQGLVEIRDEGAHALRAGYTSSRAVRTWQERMAILAEQGFIEVKPKAVRRFGYVLLRHPNRVITNLREAGRVDDQLWMAFAEVCQEFGVETPADPTEGDAGEAT